MFLFQSSYTPSQIIKENRLNEMEIFDEYMQIYRTVPYDPECELIKDIMRNIKECLIGSHECVLMPDGKVYYAWVDEYEFNVEDKINSIKQDIEDEILKQVRLAEEAIEQDYYDEMQKSFMG